MHQLRGRVGRSEKQAYAYFLRSRNIINKKNADKRLDALMSADSLSAGFLLALKDLEIRGAGEILGSNQSGVFESIGLELYTRMIKKASEFIKSGELISSHWMRCLKSILTKIVSFQKIIFQI